MCNRGNVSRWIGRVLAALALLVCSSRSLEAGAVTIAWDPNTEADVIGYVVYYGTASGSYSSSAVVTGRTSWTGTSLTVGQQYHFAVSAFNASGVQSPLSEEISATIPLRPIPGDLNGDASVDLLWRQTQNGEVSVSQMNGLSLTLSPLASVAVSWQIAGVADLDGDELSDIVWRETNTGDVAIWHISTSSGSVSVSAAPIVASGVPLAWQIAGARDLDGDGKADLVWRNTQTGDVSAWLMDGATVRQGPLVATGVPLSWQIVGLGDLDRDRKADLVWRNSAGDVAVWLMDGVTVKQAPVVASGVPLAWQVSGVGDLDGDGKADLVWRQTQSGDVAAWLMDGVTVKQAPVVASGVPLTWQIAKVADVDGDGKADLVWRHMQTGDVAEWLMDGATIRQAPVVAFGVPLTSQIQP